jgi:predicted type IV restriction endonuclease
MPEQPKLEQALESVKQKIKRYKGRNRSIGEENTKATLIEPVIEALGWDIRDVEDVHREYRANPQDKPVDYALQALRKPRLFIEAKGLGQDLSDRKWVSQVLSYATVAGVGWCVLTDGDAYRFYNATVPLDADKKLFCEVNLSEAEPQKAAEMLSLLSRASLDGDLLDAYWKAHFVDRRVKQTLDDLVSEQDNRLVRLLRRELSDLKPAEIADSLNRLDTRIEVPAAWALVASETTTNQHAGSEATQTDSQPAAPSDTRPKTYKSSSTAIAPGDSKKVYGVSLKEIIDAGVLSAPIMLFRTYRKTKLQATLNPDGTIEFNGERYQVPSNAASAARTSVTGQTGLHSNGWSFWRYTDSTGKTRKLADARANYLAGPSAR